MNKQMSDANSAGPSHKLTEPARLISCDAIDTANHDLDHPNMQPFNAETELRSNASNPSPISDGPHALFPHQRATMAMMSKPGGTVFIRPGFTIPLAQCGCCDRHHMWPTRHRHSRELLLWCFAWPFCGGTIPDPTEIVPEHFFKLDAIIDGGATNEESSLGATLAMWHWQMLVVKAIRVNKNAGAGSNFKH